MDAQILFGVKCVDEVALQAVLPRHSSGVAWEVWAVSCCKVERKAGGTKAWRHRIRSFEPGLRPWKRRMVKESKEGEGFHQGEKARKRFGRRVMCGDGRRG